MTAAAVPLSRRTVLADALVGQRTLAKDALLVLAGITVVAALAQAEIPMWPVPITGQTLGVMLVAAALGFRRGVAALVGYMALGLAGAPIFAGFTGSIATIGKPSFGFIIGFIATAAVVGALAERRWDRRPVLAIALFGLASLIPFAFGIPYMAMVLATLGTPVSLGGALAVGFLPFIVGGLVKWAIAAAALPLAWKGVRALDRSAG
ncbi:biotin transport system substrate-specific component [Agrococcus baldri]|uniref:Biotin transporter n=1 Tax=Agrococcus baldri TaxID=153730 RepID=A0AA94HPN1_9MICO|nr:biotin transporter BioY [Agrococcus baldri]SFS18354.1 biotin transport system substrate-specific component [Agrococcus baldri]